MEVFAFFTGRIPLFVNLKSWQDSACGKKLSESLVRQKTIWALQQGRDGMHRLLVPGDPRLRALKTRN